ncbi:MAG: selenium cofactor biosynthesis protein YqeC [Anaerolineales bacterium]
MIELRRALRLENAPQIAFVGAGGKTATIFTLVRQFDKPVLVTSSTHFATDQTQFGDLHVAIDGAADIEKINVDELPAVTVLTSSRFEDDRVVGLSMESLNALNDFARVHGLPLIIEADGARRLPLKAPAVHEPAIPGFVETVVVVTGLSGLGKSLSEEFVHRPERFTELSGLKLGEPITANLVAKVLLHPNGGLKNVPAGARKIVLLNQADTHELISAGRGLAEDLLSAFDAVLIASLEISPDVVAVHERVAAIIMAAGDSKRLGKPKQLLDWKGKPFVRAVVETALAAKLDPVIVVTGSNSDQVGGTLDGLRVEIVNNPIWPNGQSTSVKAGIAALPANVGAALFMVVDQPQVPVSLIEALRAEHSDSLVPIVAPMVDGQRSNPVLFDRATFADFAQLEGDVGGRAIFSKHQVTWLPWLDASLAIDVDVPEDYDRLLRRAG